MNNRTTYPQTLYTTILRTDLADLKAERDALKVMVGQLEKTVKRQQDRAIIGMIAGKQ